MGYVADAYVVKEDKVREKLRLYNQDLNNYDEKVKEINSYINQIESSSDWVDLEVKSAFVNLYRAYIKRINYNTFKVKHNFEYLEQKLDNVVDNEKTMSEVMKDE